MTIIRTAEALRDLYAQPGERSQRKQLDHLDPHLRTFVARSPFVVLATTSADGHLDASPRGGRPGFVIVPDQATVLVPDWPGNNRLDSLTNIIEHGGIGLLFMIPGVDETARINGRAELVTDEAIRETCTEGDRVPKLVIRVRVEAAFFHCAKAFMRSKLWSKDEQIDRSTLPPLGVMLRDQLAGGGDASKDAVESQDAMLARYRRNLY